MQSYPTLIVLLSKVSLLHIYALINLYVCFFFLFNEKHSRQQSTKLEQVIEVQQELIRLVGSAIPARNETVEPLSRPSATLVGFICNCITTEDRFSWCAALHHKVNSSMFMSNYFQSISHSKTTQKCVFSIIDM